MLKKILIILIVFICSISAYSQTNYYVSNTDGGADYSLQSEVQAAWNSGTFSSGDSILYYRGDIFDGSLSLGTYDGVVFGAYGSGALPIFTLRDTVPSAPSTWTETRTNIWSTYIPSNTDDNMYFLQINGVQHVIGRYPNDDWHDTISRPRDRYAVYDSSRTDPDDYWNGANIWLGNQDWTRGYVEIDYWDLDSHKFEFVTQTQDGYYSDQGTPDYVYVLSNHWRTLDQQGEWAFDEDTDSLHIYSTASLDDSTVTYSRDGNLVTIAAGSNNLVFENIHFTMTNDKGIEATGTNSEIYANGMSGLEIRDCRFDYLIYGIDAANTYNTIIERDTLHYCLFAGVELSHDSLGVIRDCYATDINVHPGEYHILASSRAYNALFEWVSDIPQYVGCYRTKIYRNYSNGSGSSAINFTRGSGVIADSNYLINGGRLITDYCGGVYNSNNSPAFYFLSDTYEPCYIRNNYVDVQSSYDDMIGINVGTAEYQAVHGIYTDNYTENITIENNFVYGGRSSYLAHWNDTVTFRNNIGINIRRYAFSVSGRGRNFTVENNVWIAPWDGSYSTSIWPMRCLNAPVNTWLSIDSNYYLQPNDHIGSDDFITIYNGPTADYNSISTWEANAYVGDNEKTDAIRYEDVTLSTIDSMYFWYYNRSDTTVDMNEVWWADYSYSDIDGVPTASKTVQPYTTEILIATQGAAPYMILYSDDTQVTCSDSTNGAIDLTVIGGEAPFTYAWTGPNSFTASTQDISDLEAGTYNVTVTDNLDSNEVYQTIITAPSAIDISGDVVNTLPGQTTGSIDVTVSGGTPSYTYSWDDGPSSEDRAALDSGWYYIDVYDLNLCYARDSFHVDTSSLIGLNFRIVGSETPIGGSVSTSTRSRAQRFISDTTGFADSIFVYHNAVTSSDCEIAVGIYRDSLGAAISEPTDTLMLGPLQTIPTAAGWHGYALHDTLHVDDGDTLWLAWTYESGCNSGATSGTVGGKYDFNTTQTGTLPVPFDSEGSDVFTEFNIYTKIWYGSTPSTPDTCNNIDVTGVVINEYKSQADGAIDATPSGGTTPYTYLWSPGGATTEDVGSLSAGVYTITVTDDIGCTADSAFTVTNTPIITISGVVTDLACNGDGTGAINVTVGGGVPPYTYVWSHGPTTEDLINLDAGLYSINVTDDEGNGESAPFTVTEPTIIILSAVVTNAGPGDNDGAIDLTVTGGVPGYTYLWSHGPTTQDVANLSAGNYTVTVTDNTECYVDSTIIVSGVVAAFDTIYWAVDDDRPKWARKINDPIIYVNDTLIPNIDTVVPFVNNEGEWIRKANAFIKLFPATINDTILRDDDWEEFRNKYNASINELND
jgi:hypothetical protein